MLLSRSKTQFLARVALMIALSVVVRRVLTPQVQGLNLGGMPILLSGFLLGPLGGAYVGMFSDILGIWVAPTGPYHPFFTLTAMLTGCMPPVFLRMFSLYGVVWESDAAFLVRLTGALVATQLLTKVVLMPLFCHMLFGWPISVTAAHNLAVQTLHVPLYAMLIFSVLKAMRRSPALQWA
jgi:riboflavin transporter